ncbi:ribosomal subunit interface protein [Rubellimicrobium roseum]|uniref:Ribosomal subunit interface protein n=1 Tax=Rubellimicrobium roseum TaxID=687525 RepID=A0A5C4N949_9RHOB|nr:ribosomal subunit interface protein [Rubellimicrobium roseum]TNC59555.1 ribosomal subunit interface protein [Rubellimicrobium roseum]
MHIQFTHAEDLHVDAASQDRIEAQVRVILGRFENQLTAVVFHLNDQNASRESGDDKYCSCEARPTGHEPVAVHHTAGTVEEACSGAAKKMQRRLDTVLGKRSDVKGGASIRTGL